MHGRPGFWDIDERYVRLSEAGDPLEKPNSVAPWDDIPQTAGQSAEMLRWSEEWQTAF